MISWNTLFERFDACLAAQAERPYDPVKVQGLGMAFALAWNFHKAPICILLDEDPDDFSYAKWREWVPRVRQLLDAQLKPKPLRADIKFGNGQVIRCVGRVRNGVVVPWSDDADVRAHIAHVNQKNPDAGLEVVRVIQPSPFSD